MEPMGDMALLFRFAHETSAMAFARQVQSADLRQWGLVDVTGAYLTVSLHLGTTTWQTSGLLDALRDLGPPTDIPPPACHVVPCCYDFGEDLDWVGRALGLARDEVIAAHSSTTYTVFAVGFIPGFAYLGWLPIKLSGLPRRETPRTAVLAGSVAIAGKQTGVYPSTVPGGWHLIGRTPCRIAGPEIGYFPLKAGDTVRFRAIDPTEYSALEGKDLHEVK